MTGARPNGRHTCAIRVRRSIALDSAGSSAIFLCSSRPAAFPVRSVPGGSGVAGNRASGWLRPGCRAGLRGSVRDCSRPPRGSWAGAVRKVLRRSRPSGAIAHIKFASCRKGVRSPLLKTHSVTPVTLHEPCQVRACHLQEAECRAIGHPGEGLSSWISWPSRAPSWRPAHRNPRPRAGGRSGRPSRAPWRAVGADGGSGSGE